MRIMKGFVKILMNENDRYFKYSAYIEDLVDSNYGGSFKNDHTIEDSSRSLARI